MIEEKLYVIVRSDFSKARKAVQAGHAVAKFVQVFPYVWRNKTLIYLRVSDEKELSKLLDKLLANAYKVVEYREPSWNNSLTAVAAFSNEEVDKLIKDLKLL